VEKAIDQNPNIAQILQKQQPSEKNVEKNGWKKK
jgi:hypothetical protein